MLARPESELPRFCVGRQDSRDYEKLPQTSESMLKISSIRLMLRRLKPQNPFGMPVLFADASVRLVRYNLSSGVLLKLWAWNEGNAVSAEGID